MHLMHAMTVTATWWGHMGASVTLSLVSAAAVLGSLVDVVIIVPMPLLRSQLWVVRVSRVLIFLHFLILYL